MINIVYFSPSPRQASGGVKVIYRHANLINRMDLRQHVSAMVYSFENPAGACHWYEESIPVKLDGLLIADRDFVVLPECHMYDFWRRFSAEGIRYAIFVQGPYLIGGGLSEAEICEAFNRASLIMTISDEASRYVCNLFPAVAQRVVPLRWSINQELFLSPSTAPSRKISFMPRRLPDHARLVCNLIKPRLPSDWRVVALEGLTERQVASRLRDSQIFMSFSYLEGLSLPPVEAALAGNRVVGYHGQGGLEYWDPAIFREIPCGDIQGFAKAVLEEVEDIEKRTLLGSTAMDESREIARELLKKRFSSERECELLTRFVQRVAELMAPASETPQ